MHRSTSTIPIAALAFALAGCGAARPAEPATSRAAAHAPTVDAARTGEQSASLEPAPSPAHCAGRSPDTKVAAQILDEGAALVFTTSDDIETLRRRAADVTVPEPIRGASASSRLDNIQHGIRVIFQASPSTNPKELQARVVEHARQLAKRCGLVLESPKDGTAAAIAARRAEQQRKLESASHSKSSSSAKPPPKKVESKKRDSDTKSAPPPPKPEAKKPPPKPAAADKPKPADKPKVDQKPSSPVKPPLPPLPGPRPDPILPRPNARQRQLTP